MAKTSASHVWFEPIKEIGNGYIKCIAQCIDLGAGGLKQGNGMAPSTTAGNLTKFVTADPDWNSGITVAEDIADDDRYCLIKKIGAEILHNQKLVGAYQIGAAVYKTGAGLWSHVDHGVPASLLTEIGIVVGPADRVTSEVLKGINDALSTSEPVNICL
ncbi:hypothetical protein LCGC14_1841780 [marine sediment metagenome]|uniref:Uncharacterized protein n=1 Tax=marine sediment metagenome TaxID=412755 RepID=A0A0F9ISJ4_9ZZZZ